VTKKLDKTVIMVEEREKTHLTVVENGGGAAQHKQHEKERHRNAELQTLMPKVLGSLQSRLGRVGSESGLDCSETKIHTSVFLRNFCL
jgi:hypothetical protein